jgi:N,N'-diacetyllegionaminate synthase
MKPMAGMAGAKIRRKKTTDGWASSFTIGGKTVSPRSPALIVAEAGINHNGSMAMALRLIDAAARAGADAIKFQTFSTAHCESRYALKPDYFSGRDGGQSKHDFSSRLEFDPRQFEALRSHCSDKGILFLSMAADEPSLDLLVDIGVAAVKIGSSDTLNYPLFKAIGATGLPVIYSTGISSFDDVARGVDYLKSTGVRELALLQCTSQYPVPFSEVNLRVMDTYRRAFGVPVGFSDHSRGIHVALAAVARGARIIEKHFTLSRRLPGVDHAASIEPDELARLVTRVRDVEAALGDGIKRIENSEREHLTTMRKSLFSMVYIQKGDRLTRRHIAAKRPGGGILPTEIDGILGRRAAVDIPADEFIRRDMLLPEDRA